MTPLSADDYQYLPDNRTPRQAYPGKLQQWEDPQVSRWFSRLGVRMGYHAQSLPPV